MTNNHSGPTLDLLEEVYGFAFPEDLSEFWRFANEVNPEAPLSAFSGIGMDLTGPFDVLAGRVDRSAPPSLPMVLHMRYFQDPPEFFTVARGSTDGLHWGYWLDDFPRIRPVVCSYYSNDEFEITETGGTLFQSLSRWLSSSAEGLREGREYEPEQGAQYDERLEEVAAISEELGKFGSSAKRAGRPRSPTMSTVDGMGLDLPPESLEDSSTRPEGIEATARAGSFQPLLTLARSALTRNQPGTALYLARTVWTLNGSRAGQQAGEIMASAYTALGRLSLARVVRDHTQHRDLKHVDLLTTQTRSPTRLP